MLTNKSQFINREISWLSFNARVLQEARDPKVPLLERIKFLGIYSSNLDEFYRVRVATHKRLVTLKKKTKNLLDDDPQEVLRAIQEIVTEQEVEFEQTYQQILEELEKHHIFIIDETKLTEEQEKFVTVYFQEKVRPAIIPLMTNQLPKFPSLKAKEIYLAVHLVKNTPTQKSEHAIVEVPTSDLPRFVVLPNDSKKTCIMLLEDVVRYNLDSIFSVFQFRVREAFPIKITRDAELDIEDDVRTSFVEKITKSIKRRTKGQPVRLTYDSRISNDSLRFLTKRLGLAKHDTLLPEKRYLNFKDFIKFPKLGLTDQQYQPSTPLPQKDIRPERSLMRTIQEKDILLHYPYQSFHYLIDLLREAAIDPRTTGIRMTLYRVAEMSKVINALSKAAKNGKAVTALLEFQARFDEEANIYWANQLIEDGVRVIHGIPGLKVHAKLCLITRKIRGKTTWYVAVGTGNFNEDTAKLYADHTLFTSDRRITSEVRDVFRFLKTNYKIKRFKHIVMSPFFMRDQWIQLIKNEMKNARTGREAYIFVKLNSLVDREMIQTLYEASQVGVKIRLIVRGICSLIPGVPGLSENIEAISIVDKYLEHSRIFVFCHGGKPKYYISSADWMTRNLDRRVEVACPIYDKNIQRELQTYLDIQWKDNTKVRILNGAQDNHYRPDTSEIRVNAQEAIYDFLKSELDQPHSDQ